MEIGNRGRAGEGQRPASGHCVTTAQARDSGVYARSRWGGSIKQWVWQQDPEAESSHLELQATSRQCQLEVMSFKLSDLPGTDTLPSARPHLLKLPKQCHQLGTKCSNREQLKPYTYTHKIVYHL